MMPPVNALAKFKGQNDFEERGFRACVQGTLDQKDQKIVGKKRGRRNAILGFNLGQQPVLPPPLSTRLANSNPRGCLCRNLDPCQSRQWAVPTAVCGSFAN